MHIHWQAHIEAETPILWPPDVKNWLIGKDYWCWERQEEKGMTEDEMVGWHHWLNGHEFEQAPGVGDGWGSLACCSPWCCKKSDTTEQLKWLTALILCCPERTFSVTVSGGYYLVVLCGLLIAVASLFAEHKLWGMGFRGCSTQG